MNKFAKAFTFVFAAAVTVSCAALSGCADEDDPYVYTPIYTIPEEIPTDDPNAAGYSVAEVERREDSPLADKTIYWLGSSVTYGSASGQESMADFLSALTGCKSVKEAVSGTTLYDDGGNGDSGVRSYTRRMVYGKNFDKSAQVDAFVCQISTNDARNDRLGKWGAMREDDEVVLDSFDTKTTLGGVEYIISYVTTTWNCPVYFYSGSYFGDSGVRSSTNPTGTNYGKLVNEVKKIVDKWNGLGYEVGIIDLFNDADFNAAASDDYYKWCTSDAIHPRKAGYLQWWTPYFEAYLCNELE